MFWTSLFTAIGTVGAVLVAIYLNICREWRRRPKLEIEFSIGEPYCRPTTVLIEKGPKQEEFTKGGYSIRIKVINKGSSTALNCRCRLENIYQRINNRLQLVGPFDPLGLHWVDHPWEDFGPTSLPPKASQFVDVFHSVEAERVLYIRREHFLTGIISTIAEKGEYYFHITAYAENAEPRQETFWLNWKQQWHDIDMRQLTPEEVKRLPYPPEEPLERIVERLLFRKMARKRLQGILKLILRNRNG